MIVKETDPQKKKLYWWAITCAIELPTLLLTAFGAGCLLWNGRYFGGGMLLVLFLFLRRIFYCLEDHIGVACIAGNPSLRVVHVELEPCWVKAQKLRFLREMRQQKKDAKKTWKGRIKNPEVKKTRSAKNKWLR